MARSTKGKSNASTSNSYRKADWANIKINDDDIPLIIERSGDHTAVMGGLFTLIDEGWDVSIKRKDNNQTFSATITACNPNDISKNVGLSSFAPDVWVAVSALLFKYYDVAEGKPEDFINSSNSGIG